MIFTKDQARPVATTIQVPKEIVDLWIPRKTQISMVEAIAVPIAAHTFQEKIKIRQCTPRIAVNVMQHEVTDSTTHQRKPTNASKVRLIHQRSDEIPGQTRSINGEDNLR